SSQRCGLGSGTPKERGKTMAKTYRDVAIDQMIATVEEAMSRAIDWWGSLPPPMNEAIDKFRVQLGAAIDSVEFVKRELDRRVPEPTENATDERGGLVDSRQDSDTTASCSSKGASTPPLMLCP